MMDTTEKLVRLGLGIIFSAPFVFLAWLILTDRGDKVGEWMCRREERKRKKKRELDTLRVKGESKWT